MSDQSITLQLEIPPEIPQQDVWSLEERLSQVPGITTDLREPKDPIVATLLFIAVQAVTTAEGINAIHDLAQNIYDFLHPNKQEANGQQWNNKVVIFTLGKRIELYNLTSEEIEKIIKQ